MVREGARDVKRPVVLSALGIDFSIGETPKNVFGESLGGPLPDRTALVNYKTPFWRS